MPCWTIHLGVATKLNENYKLNKDQFLYGSVIPDVMQSNVHGRDFTHFFGPKYHELCVDEIITDVDGFKSVYEDRLNKELILGYYVHLLTDFYYNDYVFRNCYIRDEEGHVTGIKTKEGHTLIPNPNDSKGRRKIKQNDFINFGKTLFENGLVDIPEDFESIRSQLDLLENHFLGEEELKARLEYFKSPDFREFNTGYNSEAFTMCDINEYQKLFDECVAFCDEKVKKYIKK